MLGVVLNMIYQVLLLFIPVLLVAGATVTKNLTQWVTCTIKIKIKCGLRPTAKYVGRVTCARPKQLCISYWNVRSMKER